MSNSPETTGLEIAVIGLGGRFPGAADVHQFWTNLCNGTESIRFFSDDELVAVGVSRRALEDPTYVKARGYLEGAEDFDAQFFGFTPCEAEITDPQHRLFLECAWEALEDAGHDPAQYPGEIGVYAAAGLNTYAFLLLSNAKLFRSVGMYQAFLATDKDFLATRTSYKLGLTGPSLSIQTACSASLVAVHVACQALLAGECDMALAGGVRVSFPQEAGYRYQEGGIFSPDGHCRAFDAASKGTVSGNGVGVVVLKRLDGAREDGDRILALIKGSAINNDGSDKVGFTAPSIAGQSKVIRTALAVAEVESETVDYVEAHGTGTVLGDPIEITSLTKAFGDQTLRQVGCAIGSVKTNVGHLDAAAGVAGLIKTVLALHHRMIPPSLHFSQANPQIDFENSPFHVNTRCAPWPANDHPRRAGVSSFGIGGTNAHVVLEEMPETAPSGPSRPWQLILLSARTTGALERMTENLAAHLEAQPEIPLADIAFTLQRGRRSFPHRRMLLCRDLHEARRALKDLDPTALLTQYREPAERSVVFLFPGQGAQYVGMGRELYQQEERFREHFDRCADLLEPSLDRDLRQVLFAPEERAEEAGSELAQTWLTQPALFAVEYALARLWMSWGVMPGLMIGHSLGEYVAACLAGVFSLEDALALVALRGRLMHQTPVGAMLAVPLAEAEIRALLDDQLDLAALNGPESAVVSGTPERVAKLERDLAGRGLECKFLPTHRAFHSSLMEPALAPFAEALDQVTLNPPELAFLSNLTGAPIRVEEATDPGYWVRHLRETVRFGEELGQALAEPHRVFLEVGPGHTLSGLVRRHPDRRGETVILPSLNHPRDRQPEAAVLLGTLGRLWLAGIAIAWDGFWNGEDRRRVALPSYPFERRTYRIQPGEGFSSEILETEASVAPPVAEEAPETPWEPAAEAEGNRPDLATPYVEPESEVERIIAQLWEELLGIRPVGRHDNFFELGGHSLLATRVAVRLRERLQAEISLAELFEQPTVAGLAAPLAELRTSSKEAPPIPDLPSVTLHPEQGHEPFPLTDVQQAYWIGRSDAFALGNVGTHNYVEVEYDGLDLERFTFAFRRLIRRHGMLRMVVLPDGHQQILATVPAYEVVCLDLRRLAEAEKSRGLQALRQVMSHQVLPSDRWPLFDIRAARLTETRYRLHISFDFLIGDAWSWQIFLGELAHYYQDDATELPALTLSFRDYVLAEIALEDSDLYRRAAAYWRERLTSLPPAPDLPLAREMASIQRPRFVRRSGMLEAEAWQSLKNRAVSAGLTPSATVAAAFGQVLTAWSKSPRFTLNLTLFNRLPLHPEVSRVIGDFTSLILLEVDGGAEDCFRARARRLQKRLWNDLDHRFFSGVRVLRELSKGGERVTMPVVFTSLLTLNPQEQSSFESSTQGQRVYSVSQTPQVWLDHQVGERQGALVFNWDAVEDLFCPGVLDAMFETYEAFLRRLAAAEEAWEEPSWQLVPARQLEQRTRINATEEIFPDTTLSALFRRQVALHPQRTAVVAANRNLTYDELGRRSAALARRLRELGAERNELVAVVAEKGWEQVVAVLAIVEAGAAYLPVDPSLPRERFEQILEQGQSRLALVASTLDAELDWPSGIERLVVDTAPLADPGDGPPEPGPRPEDLAYVIFTSGSTGIPKGVMIDHRGAVNTLLDINRRYRVGPEDRTLGVSALNFDLSVYDIFGLLAAGGAVVIPEPQARGNPAHWLELMSLHRVTLWNSVPALMEMLVEHAADGCEPVPPSLRLILLSGDWIPVNLPERIRRLWKEVETISLGGATEASVWSIFYPIGEVDRRWASIPYGRPLANQTFHVLDGALGPRPIWVPGELYIGGTGVARGYWRDEDKTRERFFQHPRTGDLLYRTGDLGRYLPDGNIEFLGRVDNQVKIRGYRIELGEIEAALLHHPRITAAALTAPGDPQRGGRRLVAYVVSEREGGVRAEDLREDLQQKLPSYMLPARFIFLEALPLTANGKVDRRALREPDDDGPEPEAFGLPQTPTQELLCGIWAELLEIDPPGIRDDFFALGGDSLQATRVVSRIRQLFQVEVPLRCLFESGTVAEIADQVERRRAVKAGAGVPPLEHEPSRGRMPVSFPQQRFWFLDQLQPRDPAYHIPAVFRVTGHLAMTVLNRAMSEIVERHEALRTTFHAVAGEPRQEVGPAVPVAIPRVDLSALSPAHRQSESRRWMRHQVRLGFDLELGPLFRLILLQLATAEHLAVLTLHHIIADAWSMGVWIRELTALYDAYAAGQPCPLEPLPIQYADYARWQRQWLQGENRERILSYWRTKLAGTLRPVDLPADRSRRAGLPGRLGYHRIAVPEALAVALERLGRQHNVTLFMTALAGLHTLLFRYTRQREVTTGSPIANRNRREIEGLIGCFINTLVLRTNVSGNRTFAQLLAEVRETTLGAYDHQDLPFEMLVEDLHPVRDPTRNPLFEVMFVQQNIPVETTDVAGVSLTPVQAEMAAAQYDATLALLASGPRLAVSIEYAAELFDATTARRILQQWLFVLESAVADPQQRLAELGWLTPAQRHQLLREWNPPAAAPAAEDCLHRLLAARARRNPERIAVVFTDRYLSYAELDRRADRLAQQLISLGVEPGARLGVSLNRSLGLIVGLLAIHKAGAAYVPLDPDYPPARRAFIAADAGVSIVLAEPATGNDLGPGIGRIEIDEVISRTDTDPDAAGPPAVPVDGAGLAYVLYTSGSTGQPKGVMVPHRALLSFVRSACDHYRLSAQDRVLQFASINFDTSLEEIYPCLLRGGTLVLRTPAMLGSDRRFLDACTEQNVTVLDLPTAYWHQLAGAMNESELSLPPSVRLVIIGGEEAQPQALAVGRRRLGPGVRLLNTYGPTEATVVTTLWEAPVNGEIDLHRPVAIGRPLPATRGLVLDPGGRPLPIGAPGELHLGGRNLAAGYHASPGLTAERFIPDPFGAEPGSRLYRTGDRVRLRHDGQLEFLGRIDRQVKIRGFRVELGEVEACLVSHPSVREATVLVREDTSGALQLVGYVTPESETAPTPDIILRFLEDVLPAYLVPSRLRVLERFPLTGANKIDQAALLLLDDQEEDGAAVHPAMDPVEGILAGIWSELLGRDAISANDHFFELGGHSLLATQLLSRILKTLCVDLELRALFAEPTLGGLARRVRQAMATGAIAEVPPIERVSRRGEIPLSFAQQRLWFLDQLISEGAVYNISTAVLLEGELEVAALEAAFNGVLRRHEVLRSQFHAREGVPYQVIVPYHPRRLPLIDLSALETCARETEMRALATEDARRAADLTRDLLVRFKLIRLEERRHAACLTVHHIVSDGWSMEILVRELTQLYRSYLRGDRPALPALPLQYADFAAWQRRTLRGEVLSQHLDYWRKQLADAPGELALPIDRPRPAVPRFRGDSELLELPEELSRNLRTVSRQEGVTLFMILLAAFKALLFRYTGQTDIVINTGIAGRNRSEIEGLIGFFVNTLPLRTDLSGDPSFRNLLHQVRDVTLEAHAHQDLPFEKMVQELDFDRSATHNPLSPVVFDLDNVPRSEQSVGDLRLSPLFLRRGTAKADLVFMLRDDGRSIRGELEYDTDLFDAATVCRMLVHFQRLLEAVSRQPDLRVLDVELEEQEIVSMADPTVSEELDQFHFDL